MASETLVVQLSQDEKEMHDLLVNLGQSSLLSPMTDINKLRKVCNQTKKLNADYPGGLTQYLNNSKDLINKSLLDVNPYEGFTPSVPVGKTLKFGSPEFGECEAVGFHQLKHTGFALVAGGLGERLGYDNIKISLSSELLTQMTFMELYASTILSYQRITGSEMLPLFIMTSDQTDTLTREYFAKNDYFGLKRSQVTICKQNGVPALADRNGLFLIENDEILCKPHGHGDVHILMYQSGTAKKWLDNGINYVVFFQDTNGLAFHGIPSLVGTSHLLDLEVNSLAVSRQAKEKVGGICTLTRSDGSGYTINVEYNQLDSMIKTFDPRGDVNDPTTGCSPYPGNINVLCFKLSSYVETLDISGGSIPEFVNPKWTPDKSAFKSPTRLECMMQEYPKLLKPTARVGFTTLDRWLCFSAVKNSATNAKIQAAQCGLEESLASGELDIYRLHIQHLITAGCTIGKNCKVVITPKCGVTAAQITSHFGNGLILHDDSVLVIDGSFKIEHLEVKGALILKADTNTHVIIRHLKIDNQGWSKKEVDENDINYDTQTRSRGYTMIKNGTEVRHYSGHFKIVEEF